MIETLYTLDEARKVIAQEQKHKELVKNFWSNNESYQNKKFARKRLAARRKQKSKAVLIGLISGFCAGCCLFLTEYTIVFVAIAFCLDGYIAGK